MRASSIDGPKMDDTEPKSVAGMGTPALVVVTSLVLGGIALLVSYVAGRFSRQSKTASTNERKHYCYRHHYCYCDLVPRMALVRCLA